MTDSEEHAPTDTPSPSGQTHALVGPSGDLLSEVADEDRANRLQALLAQWLRMENVVVLLGAGASVSRGGPVMARLEEFVLTQAREIAECSDTIRPSLPIINARLQHPARSSPWFEQWLTYLANASHVLADERSPISSIQLRGIGADGLQGPCSIESANLDSLIQLLGRLIYIRCSLQLPLIGEHESPTGHHALVAKLVARDPALGRAHIFTTNYDTLIEQALDDLGIQYADGFVGTVGRRFDSSVYGLDVYYPGEVKEGRVRRFDKFIHLYKPHGSIHWRRRQNDGRIIQVRDRQLQCWEDLERAEKCNRLAWVESRFAGDEDPIGILPTENKFVQTLGMPYSHLFRAFAHRLAEPQTLLIVCGYSFGDDHINAVIDEAMTNPTLVLLVVTPSGGGSIAERIARYQKAGERAFLLHGIGNAGTPTRATFDDFTQVLLPHVKWMDDYRRLREAENAIRSVHPSQRGTGVQLR